MKRKKSAFVIDTAPEEVRSNALKFIGSTDTELRVGNHIVLFGNEKQRDLDNEFFTPNTNLESSYTRANMVIEDWEHGYGPEEDGMGPSADEIFGRVDWSTAKSDQYGVWVERVLDRRNKYMQYIEPLLNAGMIGTSSESIPEDVQILKTGEIVNWPLRRDTLTVMPAEPRMLLDNRLVAAMKSLAIALPTNEAKPEAARSAAAEAAKAVAQAQTQSPPKKTAQEKKKMNKEQLKALKAYAELNGVEVEDLTEEQQAYALDNAAKPEPIDIAALVEDATQKAVKAAMEAAPAINGDAGKSVTVTLDEADRPFRSLAENAKAIKDLAVKGKEHPRLRYLKAPLGASEGVPSDGGILLEPTLTPEVIKPVHESGSFSSLARKLPVGSNSNSGWINGVDETSRVAGSRWGGVRGYRLAEADTLTKSKPTFRRINWELKKYGVLVYGTDELLKDSSQFSAVVNQAANEELNFMVNDDIMNGQGTAGAKGFMNSNALITVTRTTGSKILGDDISAMYNRMDIRGRKNAVWFIGNDSQPQLDNLFAVGSTAVLYPYASIGMDGVQRLYGRPVVVTEFNKSLNTTGDIVLADMSQYLMWEKAGVESASSIHVQFLTDEEVFRFIYRCYGEPSVDSALTPLNGSTTTSPFVVLTSAT